MESFFLSETAKYLYLLHTNATALPDFYIFSTEGHILPVLPSEEPSHHQSDSQTAEGKSVHANCRDLCRVHGRAELLQVCRAVLVFDDLVRGTSMWCLSIAIKLDTGSRSLLIPSEAAVCLLTPQTACLSDTPGSHKYKACRAEASSIVRVNVQSAEELRKAFSALKPHIDDAATLWQRRCHACEVVSEAMAAVPPPGGYSTNGVKVVSAP